MGSSPIDALDRLAMEPWDALCMHVLWGFKGLDRVNNTDMSHPAIFLSRQCKLSDLSMTAAISGPGPGPG